MRMWMVDPKYLCTNHLIDFLLKKHVFHISGWSNHAKRI
jgi:hypothetical protein